MNTALNNWIEVNQNCKLTFINEANALYEKWNGFAHGESLRKACAETFERYKSFGADRIVLDTSESKPLTIEDTNWYFKKVHPKYHKVGLKGVAIIESANPISRLSIKNAYSLIKDSPLKIDFFSNHQEAIKWIKTI
jgi:hypothetical protein